MSRWPARASVLAWALVIPCLLGAQGAANRPIPPPMRAKLLLALLGFVILLLGMIALVMLGGRLVRRWARHSVPSKRFEPDDWARRPLVPPVDSEDKERSQKL